MSESTAKSRLGLFDAVSIVSGTMIGSGIFLAPALIAGLALSAGLGAGAFTMIWVIGGLLTIAGALSFGELAAAMPSTGGQYVYLREIFSPIWGFLYGWTLFFIIQCGFIAAVSIAFANYLGVFLPFVSSQTILFHAGPFSLSAAQAAAIALILGLTFVNARGLQSGSFTQNLLTAAKIAAIVVLVGVALTSRHGNWSHFKPFAPPAISMAVLAAFAVAMSKALFGYDSWNTVTFLAGEAKNPARTIPRALALGTLLVTGAYTLLSVAYLYVLPMIDAANVPAQRIAAATAQVVLGRAGVWFIAVAIIISTAGCVNGLILTGPWLYQAMSRDGLFFKRMTVIDPARRTPIYALQYQAIWAILLVLTGSFGSRGARLYSDLLTFTSFASLLFNAITVTGVIVLRIRRPELARPYRAFGYPVVPLLYVLAAVFFLIFIAIGDPANAGLGAVLIGIGVPFYFLWFRRARSHSSAVATELGTIQER